MLTISASALPYCARTGDVEQEDVRQEFVLKPPFSMRSRNMNEVGRPCAIAVPVEGGGDAHVSQIVCSLFKSFVTNIFAH